VTGARGFERGVLLGDQPALDGSDPLGFDEIVAGLAGMILDSRASTPFTLGIEGAWGMGKSTLIGRLCKRLQEEDGVTTVMFNAWTADGGGVLEGLVKSVLNEMDPNVIRRSLRKEELITWARVVVSVAAGFLQLGNVVDTVWEKVASDPKARNDLRKLVGEAVEKWRAEVGDDRTLCIFVDDLDRCSPRGVLEVFEAMKLYLSVKGIVFVVGYDQAIVADLVLEEKGYSSKSIQSRDYIEKFIQIVYEVPRAITDRSHELVDSLLEESGTKELFGEAERQIVISGSGSNPRKIKRFINTFVLAYALEPQWRQFTAEDVVRLLLLRMQFREFLVLLEQPGGRDPVDEFLDYLDLRSALRRHNESERAEIQASIGKFNMSLGPEENYDAALARLEDNVDDEFVRCADRSELVGLLEGLRRSSDWDSLRAALASGELSLATDDSERAAQVPHQSIFKTEPSGLRVIWVDDAMEQNETILSELTALGVDVTRVSSTEELRLRLQGEFDLLISDINREGDPDAGFAAIEELRKESVQLPPIVVFFAMQVTASRKRRAAALEARLTNDPATLFEFVAEASLARRARQAEDILDSLVSNPGPG
jgi:CheY-like chemotaxis protein